MPQSETYNDTQILISWFCISLTSKSSSELQKRLELITLQLQDSELRLQEADAKNFNLSENISYLLEFRVMFVSFKHKITAAVSVSLLVMEIADLRTQLKKAQKKASKPSENCSGL